jgi:uncharacterized protein YkwD
VTIRQTTPVVVARTGTPRRLAVLLAMVMTVGALLAALPGPVAAADATEADVAAMILAKINTGRTDRGLVGYRAWTALASLASDRSARMAAAGTLSHDAAGGNVGAALDAADLPWLGYGEIIAATSYPWGAEAAAHVYGMWQNSPGHAAIMMSASYNYIGIGVVRATDGSTWVSAVVTESLDHTAPVARNRSISIRNRDDIVLRWSGTDPRLQTHTAGVRSYDIQMRRDDTGWRTIRSRTTSTALVLRNRVHGHWFSFRIRARDGRGNLSPWTSEIRVRVR